MSDPQVATVMAQEKKKVKVMDLGDLDIQAEEYPYSDDRTDWMKLEITVGSTDESHVNHTIGLVQNMISSRRVASYGTAGTLTIEPSTGDFPLLDSDSRIVPWFQETCKGAQLPDVGSDPITLTLKDGPSVSVPKFAEQGEAADKVAFTGLDVEEEFVIFLYDQDCNQVFKQWEWSYSYKYDHETGAVNEWKSQPPTETEVTRVPVLDGVDGHTAGENAVLKWSEGLSAAKVEY